MPTPSEYTNVSSTTGADTSTGPVGKNTGTTDQQTCAALQPLFDAAPQLKSQLGCDVKASTEPLAVDCDQLAQRISETIHSHLNDCITPCQQSHDQCNACIRGKLQSDMEIVNAVAGNCSEKINSYLMNIWYELTGAMESIGIPAPTPDQITAILAGGPIPLPRESTSDTANGNTNGENQAAPTGPTSGTGGEVTLTPETGPIQVYSGPITTPASYPATMEQSVKPPSAQCKPGETLVGGAGGICVPNTPSPTCSPRPSNWDFLVSQSTPYKDGVPYPTITTETFDGNVPSPPAPKSPAAWCGTLNWTDPACPSHRLVMWVQYPDAATAPCNSSGPGQPPPPPPTPPTSTCPQCQAGYAWSTDANGNPACKPTCQCPKCPENPPQPPPPPPPPEKQPSPPSDQSPSPQPPGLCGPSQRGLIETWVSQASTEVPIGADYECKEGIGSWVINFVSNTLNPLSNAGVPDDFLGHFSNTMHCAANWIYENILKSEFPSGSCDVSKTLAHYIATAIPTFLDKLFGIIPPQVSTTITQRGNYLCQYKTPSTSDVNVAWVHGILTDEEWEFGVKLNGDCIDWQKKLIESSYSNITWQDAFRLKRLGQIGGNEFTKWLQRNGINTDKDQDTFEKAYAQIPSMGDLIRMMVRDSADEQAVADNGFDNEFGDKFTGILEKWADAQGISADVAKMYWRAHWQLPSPGQLYQMLHRLREEDRDENDPYSDVVVTADDVESVLKQNDMAPEWVRALMAISYPPLSRIDIRRGYEVGALDEDALYRAYLDIGNSQTNAKILVDTTLRYSSPHKAVADGAMSQAELARAFNERLISDEELVKGLQTLFNNDERVKSVYHNQLFKRDVAERKTIVSANKRRYMTGEFSNARAVQELVGFGIALDAANGLVNKWNMELAAKYKAPAVAMLCEWYQRGMISLDDYLARVKNIGYAQDDAMRIVSVCGAKQTEKIAKEIEAARQKQQSAAEKKKKALDKAALDAMPCRPVKPKCPQPGANGSANGKKH